MLREHDPPRNAIILVTLSTSVSNIDLMSFHVPSDESHYKGGRGEGERERGRERKREKGEGREERKRLIVAKIKHLALNSTVLLNLGKYL